jgi:hypothetical protein
LFGPYVMLKLRSQLPNNSVYGTSVRGQYYRPSRLRGSWENEINALSGACLASLFAAKRCLATAREGHSKNQV